MPHRFVDRFSNSARRLALTFVLTAVTLGSTAAAVPAQAQASGDDRRGVHYMTLQVDQTAVTLYDQASLKAKVLESIPPGGRVSWDGTTQAAEARQWIKVLAADGAAGWMTPDSQAVFDTDPTFVTPGITIGAAGEIAQDVPAYTDSALSIPTAGKTLAAKTAFTVTDGPISAGTVTAWQVKTAAGDSLWLPDIPGYLQILTPLLVHGYPVCDGFDLKTFGVAGWDSVVPKLATLIAKGEKVSCLASVNFKNDNTPIVLVLAHAETDTNHHDTLYLFDQAQGQWTTLYHETAEDYARTERIGVYHFTTTTAPIVVWAIRTDGTGQFFRVEALQYSAAGTKAVLNVTDLYKGALEIGSDSIKLLQEILKDNEPNCCASGFNRTAYQWQATTSQFVKVLDDQPPPPYWLQGVPKQ